MAVVFDVETTGLISPTGMIPERLWVICTYDTVTKEKKEFLLPDVVPEVRQEFIEYAKGVNTWVAHNGIGFDLHVINHFFGQGTIDPLKVIDTLVISRLVDTAILGGHGLAAWGQRLGFPKGDHNDWTQLTQEMVDYCHQDVQVTAKLYEKFKPVWSNEKYAKALRVEHDAALICTQMQWNGFKFDAQKAGGMLQEIEGKMDTLEAEFQECFPAELKEVNRLKYRTKADGQLYSNVTKAIDTYPKTEVDGEELVCYDWVSFDPASPMQRIDRLWAAGWKPKEKTKGHMEYLRQ